VTVAFPHRHRICRPRRPRAPAGRGRWAAAAAVAFAAVVTLQTPAVAAQTAGPVRTVQLVDLNRYVGDWFEISRFPNRFQQQCVGDVRASYARRADGRLDVVNQCRTVNGRIQVRGIARVVDDRTFARLKVRFAPAWLSFLPFVWGDYWIIGLAEDYSWAVVGSPDREYLWILARAPRLDEESAAAARGVARANGFDVDRLIPVAQEGNQR
jgi:apolipoprotein D and lipocalin family protein